MTATITTNDPATVAAITVEADTTVSGFVLVDGERFPLTGRELDGYWYLYAGVDGEYGGDSLTLTDAVRRLARVLTVSGAVDIYFGDTDPYTFDLSEGDVPVSEAVATEIPVERTRPGVAGQIVNVYKPGTGEFVRQVRHYGTEAQARAYGLMQVLHDTDPLWHECRAVVLGK